MSTRPFQWVGMEQVYALRSSHPKLLEAIIRFGNTKGEKCGCSRTARRLALLEHGWKTSTLARVLGVAETTLHVPWRPWNAHRLARRACRQCEQTAWVFGFALVQIFFQRKSDEQAEREQEVCQADNAALP